MAPFPKRAKDPYLHSRIGRQTVHPGTLLLRQWMQPCGISQQELARMLRISPRAVNEIVNGRRAITARTAVRLADKLGMAPHYWLALQADYDIHCVFHRGERKRIAPASERFRAGRGWHRPITEAYRREKRREAILSLIEREDMEL